MWRYFLAFKPISRLLKGVVVAQNPLNLTAKKYGDKVITSFITKAALSMNRSLRDAEIYYPQGPTARTVLNRLYEKTPEEIIEAFNKYNAKIYGRIVKNLTRGQKITFVNLDTHLEPYWGKKSEWVRGGKRRQGTTKFMPIETFSLQHSGFKITLAAKPLKKSSRRDKPIERLRWAEGYTRLAKWIEKEFLLGEICLVMDGGYFRALLLAKLDVAGVYFIARASRGAVGIRRIMKEMDFDRLLPREGDVLEYCGYSISSGHNRPYVELPVRLIFVRRKGKGRDEVVPLVTNLPADYTAKDVAELYKARFWIENAYRDGRQMRVRTCSRFLSVRYALFLIGIILLNFFVLIALKYNSLGMWIRFVSLGLVILEVVQGGHDD